MISEKLLLTAGAASIPFRRAAGAPRVATAPEQAGPEQAGPEQAGMVDSIQYLRAIAAWLVVFHHLSTSLTSQFGWGHGFAIGAIGVDIFFVVSGYIMAMIAARTPQFSPLEFVLRRAARIAPLYWLMTLAFCVLCLVYPSVVNNPDLTWSRMFFSLFFLPDFVEGTTLPALMIGWTLNYEIFFYGIVASSIWLSGDRTLLVAALMLCACVAGGALVDGGRIFDFYTQPIILEFVLGILIWNYGAAIHSKRWFRPVWLLCLPPVFAGLAASGIYYDEIRYLIWGIPSAFFVLGAIPLFTMRQPWLARLGDWSFSTYLLHVYVIQLFVKVVAKGAIGNYGLLAFEAIVALGVIVLISALQFSRFERPATRALNRWLAAVWPRDGRAY
ncbi:acyltransferase [Pararhizobium sp. LjRoot255]|uniref:acyltransferase family protein n=1 Tax=Pararhizobium sp. LjRoot255 TaxID=3342298 RepID=UPI003ECDC687